MKNHSKVTILSLSLGAALAGSVFAYQKVSKPTLETRAEGTSNLPFLVESKTANLFPQSIDSGFNQGGGDAKYENGTFHATKKAEYRYYFSNNQKFADEATYLWSFDATVAEGGTVQFGIGDYKKVETVSGASRHIEIVFTGKDMDWEEAGGDVLFINNTTETEVTMTNISLTFGKTGADFMPTTGYSNATMENHSLTLGPSGNAWCYNLNGIEATKTYIFECDMIRTGLDGRPAVITIGDWSKADTFSSNGTDHVAFVFLGQTVIHDNRLLSFQLQSATGSVTYSNLSLYENGAPGNNYTLSFEGAKGDGFNTGDLISRAGIGWAGSNEDGTVQTLNSGINDPEADGTYMKFNPIKDDASFIAGVVASGESDLSNGTDYALSFRYQGVAGKTYSFGFLYDNSNHQSFTADGTWQEFYGVFTNPGKNYVSWTLPQDGSLAVDCLAIAQVTFPVTVDQAMNVEGTLPIGLGEVYSWQLDGKTYDPASSFSYHENKTVTLVKQADTSAADFATTFLSDLVCNPDGTTEPTYQNGSSWATLGSKYKNLSTNGKETFKRINSSTAYADASLEKVKEAKLRYLYIVKKYNYDNFMGFELPKSNAKSILPDWMGEKSSGEQTGAVLIVTLAALSLGLVVTLTCKKKRQ